MVEQRLKPAEDGERLIDRRGDFLAATIAVISLIIRRTAGRAPVAVAWSTGEGMQPRADGILQRLRSGFLPGLERAVACLVLAAAPMDAADAQGIEIDIDSSLAEYLLNAVCSNEDIDEAYLRSSPFVRAQIEHHTSLSPVRNIDAFLRGLEAASRCEVPEDDVFRFGPIVEDKEKFVATVDFVRSRSRDIAEFIARTLAPFTPEDLDYAGNIVLSIVGNPCGGFTSEAYFFLALNCLTEGYEEEYSAMKVVSAHEVFHAMQHEFFYPSSAEFDDIRSLDAATEHLFRWLMFEGTAEYVADSRQIDGSGVLTDFLREFSENGYRQIPTYVRFFSYTAEILAAGDDYRDRLRDVYELGFSGANRQILYYAGAAMTGHLDRTYGRNALICIFRLPPEQFVRAYHAAAMESPSKEAVPLGATVTEAAERLSRNRAGRLRFEGCVDQTAANRAESFRRSGRGR